MQHNSNVTGVQSYKVTRNWVQKPCLF